MKTVYALMTGMSLSLLAFGASAAEDKDVIDYRQHIMKTMDEQTAIIGMIVSGSAPEQGMAAATESIALAAGIALKSFEAKVPGGKAKPEVWSKWDDFSARMKKFADKSAELSAATKKGASITDVTSMLIEALPCKECHDLYRDEK